MCREAAWAEPAAEVTALFRVQSRMRGFKINQIDIRKGKEALLQL